MDSFGANGGSDRTAAASLAASGAGGHFRSSSRKTAGLAIGLGLGQADCGNQCSDCAGANWGWASGGGVGGGGAQYRAEVTSAARGGGGAGGSSWREGDGGASRTGR